MQQDTMGYVRMDRAAITRALRGDTAALVALTVLSAWTTHQPYERQFAGRTVSLASGQCPTTVRLLAAACGITRQSAARALERLARLGLIKVEAVGRDYTLVTVLGLVAESRDTSRDTSRDGERDTGDGGKAAPGAASEALDINERDTSRDGERDDEGGIKQDERKQDGKEQDESTQSARARDRAMAIWLHGRVEENAGCRVPFDVAAWADELGELRRECGVNHNAIGYTADWALASEWWGGRIVSAEALRRCFVTIAAQRRKEMKREAGGYDRNVGAHR